MAASSSRRPPRLLLLALLLLALAPRPGLAQRHDKRITGLAVLGGSTDQGRFAEVSWMHYLSDNTYLRLGLSLARPTQLLRHVDSNSAYGLSLAVAPKLFQVREVLYVHLLAGGLFRYERTHEHALAGDTTGVQQHYAGGPLLGLEADLFLGNRLSLVGTVQKAIVFPGDGLTQWPGYYGAGLRYHLR